jgi:hypothetical protein
MFRQTFLCILVTISLCGCMANKGHDNRSGFDDSSCSPKPEGLALQLPLDQIAEGKTLREQGRCNLFIQNGRLHITAVFEDSDVVAKGEKDGDEHYRLGDCGEIFIQQDGAANYWEIWVAPTGYRTVATWQARQELESIGTLIAGKSMEVSTAINGTLNDGKSNDNGWIMTATIPLPENSDTNVWKILVARQNYDSRLDKAVRELSSFPQISKTDFHRTEDYFKIKPGMQR